MDMADPRVLAAIVAALAAAGGGLRWLVGRRDTHRKDRADRLREHYAELHRWIDDLPTDRLLPPPPEPAATVVRTEGRRRAARAVEELAGLYAKPLEEQGTTAWVTARSRWRDEFISAVRAEMR